MAYASTWKKFAAWCATTGVDSLPAMPQAIALYITHLADAKYKAATIDRALVAISQVHKLAGHPTPTSAPHVREVRAGIRRTLGTAQVRKAPVLVDDLRAMTSQLDDTKLIGLRDRALLVLGFSGAFRRSELVALDVEDVVFVRDGLEVTIRRSKTDQQGEGRKLGVPFGSAPTTCPVRALRAWLDAAEITTGAVFRSVNRHGRVSAKRLGGHAVACVVKSHAEAAGLDATTYSGHSLRAGLATAAAKAGKSERVIAKTTGHKSMTVLRRYIRDAELLIENAASGIGL